MKATKLYLRLTDTQVINTDDYLLINDDSQLPPYHEPTLRDIAIVLNRCCGQGVIWNLARELSERTGVDLETIDTALNNIVTEYAQYSDEEALEKYGLLANYIRYHKTTEV